MVSNLDLIRRVPLFLNLTEPQAESLAEVVVKRRYKRGETIVEQGKRSRTFYVVLSGRARVYTSHAGGREVILATITQGGYIGEMSLIDKEPHSATVRADIQTDVLMARVLLESSQIEPDGQRLIRDRMSRQDIAKMVGASREMVSRVMKDLEDRGIIVTQDDIIQINERLSKVG